MLKLGHSRCAPTSPPAWSRRKSCSSSSMVDHRQRWSDGVPRHVAGRTSGRRSGRRGVGPEAPMLDGNVRSSLTRDDAELALRLIARGSESALAAAEALLRDGGIDALLDDERLVPAMVHSRAGMHASLPLFFCAVVRRAFAQSNEPDHALADYVADVLIHFAARGRAERVSDA